MSAFWNRIKRELETAHSTYLPQEHFLNKKRDVSGGDSTEFKLAEGQNLRVWPFFAGAKRSRSAPSLYSKTCEQAEKKTQVIVLLLR